MERQPTKLNLVLGLCLVFTKLVFHVGSTVGDGRKLITNNNKNPGFISIDCGAENDYKDEETGIWYETDTKFIETGNNSKTLQSFNLDYSYFGGLLRTLRSFPEGKRNCYTLKPEQGKHRTYLIRAFFAYGNYDGKNQTPVFDLYLGVNHWETIDLGSNYYYFSEIIHTPTTDTIHACLVRGDIGVPFISSLELRPLTGSIYQTPSSPSQSLLISQGRFDVASTSFAKHSRYKDDIYDRMWIKMNLSYWYQINGSIDIDPSTTEDPYKLPTKVLKSAAQSYNLSYPLKYDFDSQWRDLDKSSKYLIYFHFCEVQQLPLGHKRILNITFGDENVFSQQPIVLEYLKPQTVALPNASQGYVRFNITATSESGAPPILNAFEVYKFMSPLPSLTDQRDVDAVMDIKDRYRISNLDWQGDPCVPNPVWDGLSCRNSRITSMNLSTAKLTGQITTSFSQLTELESLYLSFNYLSGSIPEFLTKLSKLRVLDLSFNDLSGSIPEFLAEMPNLKVLNLSGNKLTGSVPRFLEEKSSYGSLELRLEDNPGLCLLDSCKKHIKFVIPVAVSVSAFAVIFLVSLGIWIFKTKKLKVVITVSKNEESLRPKNRAVSYTKILRITSNLQDLIGEGGFGKVYYGTLRDNTQVAVKLLSQSSMQGFKEFRSEVELLMVIHHRHLVSLIGYCEEGSVRALIYEYMANGNLQQHLSEENPHVLKWNERLQIALDAAQGLDYLHNGCKPPIVHRDLKTSNILLNEKMQAKISDFGLSRAFASDINTHVSTRPAGTLGYLDLSQPAIRREYGNICHILHWVTPKLEMGDIQSIMDSRLEGSCSTNSAWKLLEIAMSCTPPSAVQRPDISHIVVELKECLALTQSWAMNPTSSFDRRSFRSDSGLIPSAR